MKLGIRFISVFSAEWFSIALGTTASSVTVYWLSVRSHSLLLYDFGMVLAILGAVAFAVVSALWASRGIIFPKLVKSDTHDLDKVSFTALIPLELIALGVVLQLYFGAVRGTTLHLLEADYFAAFALAVSLSVFEGYLLYTKSITGRELTYAILVPPISVATDVLLASTMMPLAAGLRPLITVITIWGIGISFMLFMFIGSIALAAHVREIRAPESIPIAIFPVGVSSILVINILFISSFGFIESRLALMLSIALWGFEVWNILVMAAVSIKSLRSLQQISVWAYLFPLTIFWVSSLRISSLLSAIGYQLPSSIVLAAGTTIAIVIIPLWVYSAYVTTSIISRLNSVLKGVPFPSEQKEGSAAH